MELTGILGKFARTAKEGADAVLSPIRAKVAIPRGELDTDSNREAAAARGRQEVLVQHDLVLAAENDLAEIRAVELERLAGKVADDQAAWQEERRKTAQQRSYEIADGERQLAFLDDAELVAEVNRYVTAGQPGTVDAVMSLALEVKRRHQADINNAGIGAAEVLLSRAIRERRALQPWLHSETNLDYEEIAGLKVNELPTKDDQGRRGRIRLGDYLRAKS